ncbi:MAG: putative rane-bound dehydrogenase, partial [Verrucomicrobiaceae bacterium]|nr:putative rane-bound dehydrogenase [Verrucomicrobiaceae bacterium]
MLNVCCLLSGFAAAFGAEPMSFPPVPATPPEKAEATFETLHGFHMELLAAEPQVTDPVALAYDADGNAYVAEMNDYPYTDKAHHKASQENPTDAPIGKIRLLAEADAEGHFKRSTVFADGLSWPTGIACWKGGIIVTATPDVWYLKDTNGDGVADVRKKLIAGFKKLNVQAVMNNPVWGLDNRLYLAGGSNGGEIATPGGKPLAMRRADVRLDPRDMSIALVSGGARFGNSRDDWGNRFLCNIRNPAQHIVIESRYLSRNPFLPAVSPLVDVAESGDQIPVHRASPPEAWRELRAKRWSADATVIAHMPRSELTGAGVVTSSSGITVYRGDAYPPEYRGNLFVADVAGNLFYRLMAERDGVSFKAKRVDGDHEFCAGRDLWCRPVNFTNAPDGCLHVCDMYREVIEHPWSLPEDIHAALDLERGRDKGRLYRLAPPGFKLRSTPKLSEASTADLVALLAHPNAWHRDTAHRLLFERQDKDAVPALRELLKNPEQRARLHALWTLQGLQAFSETDLSAVMADSGEHVRAAAVLLAEPLLKGSKLLRQAVLGLASDSSATVRFQVALSLGEAMDETAVPALAAIAEHDIADPWMRTAVLSASGAFTPQVGMAVLKQPDSTAGAEFLRTACLITGASASEKHCTQMLGELAQASTSHPLMTEAGALGMAAGLGRHG